MINYLKEFKQAAGRSLTADQYRQLYILHEYGHKKGLLNADDLLTDPTGAESMKNTKTILEKCFP